MNRLKHAVENVAAAHNIDIGSLANLVAYEMSVQGKNWWGTAQNLQTHDDPYLEAFSVFKDRIDSARICDELDYELVWNAFQV